MHLSSLDYQIMKQREKESFVITKPSTVQTQSMEHLDGRLKWTKGFAEKQFSASKKIMQTDVSVISRAITSILKSSDWNSKQAKSSSKWALPIYRSRKFE